MGYDGSERGSRQVKRWAIVVLHPNKINSSAPQHSSGEAAYNV